MFRRRVCQIRFTISSHGLSVVELSRDTGLFYSCTLGMMLSNKMAIVSVLVKCTGVLCSRVLQDLALRIYQRRAPMVAGGVLHHRKALGNHSGCSL